MIAKLLGWDSLSFALDDFMLLSVSINRAGRKEFVDAFKGEREKQVQQSGGGFFSGLRNKLQI